jgi:tripartite-type tricarboxylate transporter receptor subunit TctC
LNAALSEADVKDRFARLGAEPAPSSPAAFGQMAQAESAKWKRIIAERKIAVE